MILSILIILVVLFSLTALIIIHELGHFLLAKKFGVKVEEFGLFLPPRIWGKKIGETIYSINWLPLGGFVKLLGEEGGGTSSDPGNFNTKPVWQRMLIIIGGVLSFWIIAWVLLTFVFMTGSVMQVDDSQAAVNPTVQIVEVMPNSPAADAGLQSGDIIKSVALKSNPQNITPIETVSAVQNFSNAHQGEAVIFNVLRAAKEISLTLTPRINPPPGEGAVGIALVRLGTINYPWWQAPWIAAKTVGDYTISVFTGWYTIINDYFHHKDLPAGAQIVGPIGILKLMSQAAYHGIAYYLQLIALIAVYLAVFNVLPIPALDGGKLMFLAIEAIRRKPVPAQIEQTITAVFMFALLILMLVVTVGDIARFF